MRSQIKQYKTPYLQNPDWNQNKHKFRNHFLSKQIKEQKLEKIMEEVRCGLSPRSKLFSKLIHAKRVESLSAIGEKVIARPMGIIAGAILSLIGSIIVSYTAHRVGFRFPSSLLPILFIAGYLVSSIFELLVLPFKNKS